MEDERVDVDAALGDEPGQVAEVLGERRRGGIGIDEDERPPGVDRDGHEAEALAVEARLRVSARRVSQRAVEVVRPGVVRALQRLAASGALAEREAAVAADVDERAERLVAAADEDDGHVARAGGRERSRLGEIARVPDVLPAAAEDQPLLEPRDGRVEYQSQGIVVEVPAVVATA